MKAKIKPFKPTTQNLMLLESVLRQAIRNGYRRRNKGFLPTFKRWNRNDVRDAIEAYRMVKITEGTWNVD